MIRTTRRLRIETLETRCVLASAVPLVGLPAGFQPLDMAIDDTTSEIRMVGLLDQSGNIVPAEVKLDTSGNFISQQTLPSLAGEITDIRISRDGANILINVTDDQDVDRTGLIQTADRSQVDDIGFLVGEPGIDALTVGFDVSSGGAPIVAAQSGGAAASSWDAANGFARVPGLETAAFSAAAAVSPSGAILAGHSGTATLQPFLSDATQTVLLDDGLGLPSFVNSVADDDANGSIDLATYVGGDKALQATIWHPVTGAATTLIDENARVMDGAMIRHVMPDGTYVGVQNFVSGDGVVNRPGEVFVFREGDPVFGTPQFIKDLIDTSTIDPTEQADFFARIDEIPGADQYLVWARGLSYAVMIDKPRPIFQTQSNRFDVQDDGFVAAPDVIDVVFDINTKGSRYLRASDNMDLHQDPLNPLNPDVNGDNFAAAGDVLEIVAQINSVSGSAPGEGESGFFAFSRAADADSSDLSEAPASDEATDLAAPPDETVWAPGEDAESAQDSAAGQGVDSWTDSLADWEALLERIAIFRDSL